jgi:hypothetical protein
MKIVSGVLACFLLLLAPVGASAQGSDWRSVLQGEKAKTAARLAAIEQEGAPIARELRQVAQKVESHNAQHPSGTCEYPDGHPEYCTPWVNEGRALDRKQTTLRSRLIPLANEQEKLQARSEQITQLLAQPTCGPVCQQLKNCAENPNCFD